MTNWGAFGEGSVQKARLKSVKKGMM